MNKWVRGVVVICGLLMLSVWKLPMWRIELAAPQYPEGLMLQIYPDRLGGDVEIVNGLNHYIGMKTLHAEEFVEFTVLPYFILFFAALFIAVGIINKRSLLYFATGLLLLFAVVAMADFWRWEYNYGHNLDPNAAIQVPGMSYQPPLLGYKQLLNFGAFSIPDIGGWIFVAVGVLLLSAAIAEFILEKKRKSVTAVVFLPVLLMLHSCTHEPQPINIGKDECAHCKMLISDNRFGAEMLTSKGKAYKFDDIQCLLDFLRTEEGDFKNAGFYFVDFEGTHQLLPSTQSFLLKSEAIKSPMNGGMAAFSSKQSLEAATEKFQGAEIRWDELNK